MAAHGAQLGQVEFQPNHEHQEHHPKFAKVAYAFGVLRQRQRMRANHHANSQIAEHGRQLERAAYDHAKHCGQQVQQGQFQRTHHLMVADDFVKSTTSLLGFNAISGHETQASLDRMLA